MNRRELAFCHHISRGSEGTEAARLAGYSAHSAHRQAHKLRQKPYIQAEIARLTDGVRREMVLDAAEIVNQFGAIAMTRPDEFMKQCEDGLYRFKAPHELTERQLSAVQSIHTREVKREIEDEEGNKHTVVEQEFRYQFYDKANALDRLGRHFDIYNEIDRAPDGAQRFRDLPAEDLLKISQAMEQALAGAEDAEYEEAS